MKCIREKGFVTASWCREKHIPTVYLSRLMKQNFLKKSGNGLYTAATERIEDPFYFFQYRYKKSVFSYESSLYLLGLTDKIVSAFDITVENHYKFNSPPIDATIHYVSKDILNLGAIEVQTAFGNIVRTYSPERSVCDFIKSKEKADPEVYVKFLQSYAAMKNKDINFLWQIASAMKIADKVRNVMEILI